MGRQTFQEVLYASIADATAVANSNTETSVFPDITIPSGYLQEGRVLKFTAQGKHSTTGTPTLIFRLRIGGSGGSTGTLLMLSETITTASGASNLQWRAELEIFVRRGGGANGTLLVTGTIEVMTSTTTSVVRHITGVSGSDAPAEVGSLNLSQDNLLAFTVIWSAASSSNTLTGMAELLQSLN
jgi:hypothetical protein